MKPKRVRTNRLIYVQYVYERYCYSNPSEERFHDLPLSEQTRLLNDQWARKVAREWGGKRKAS